MQYDAYECLLQLLAEFTPILMMTAYLRLISYSQTFCIDYGHTAYHDGACTDWFLHLEDSSIVQTISGVVHQAMDPVGEYLENGRCVDGCQKLNVSITVA